MNRKRFITLICICPFLFGFVVTDPHRRNLERQEFERRFESDFTRHTREHERYLSTLRGGLLDSDLRNFTVESDEENSQNRGDVQATVTYDIPIVINDKVVKWLEYFQGVGRRHFVRWLSRYHQYAPMIKASLREHDLPEDLVFLAMIESGFQPVAYSRARAVGLWQFMRATGAQYGLRVNWWIDERRDPFKATVAAARHLRDLFEEFGSWYLVAASYNAGSGKVRRAIKRYNSRDFWEISKGRYLKPETKNYVPKLLAAALIAKEPAKYGFHGIQYQAPWSYTEVTVEPLTDLRKVSNVTGIRLSELKRLNPELKRSFTPPKTKYALRVPPPVSHVVEAKRDELKGEVQDEVFVHRVIRGETLWSIARRYETTTTSIQDMNGLNNPRRIRPGARLMIPAGKPPTWTPKRVTSKTTNRKRSNFVSGKNYTVRAGDTLWSIAQHFKVTIRDLKQINRIGRGNRIFAGDVLQIPGS